MPLAIAFALIALVLFVCASIARRRALALPRSLTAEYSPVQPPKRTADPVGDAILVGRDRRAVAAGLLHLATSRKVRLVAETTARGRAAVGVEVVEGAEFTEEDTELLETLFGPGHPQGRVRRFSKDRRAVGRRVRAFVDRRAAVLRRRGLLRPEGVPARLVLRVACGILLLIVVPAAAILLIAGVWLPGALCASAVALAVAALWLLPPGERRRPTPDGDRRRRHLDGLRQYMVLAEADRIRFLQSPEGALSAPIAAGAAADADGALAAYVLDEKLLPYAVIFGIERRWLAHLKIAYQNVDGRLIEETLSHASDLLLVAEALGDLADIGFAVADLVSSGGDALEVVGGVFDALN